VAGDIVTGSQPEATVHAAVERYLAALTVRLAGPTRARTAILDEIRDGLWESADRHMAQGLKPALAARAAMAEFGDPETVAAAFRPELAAAQARRVALALVRSGPLVGALWAATLAMSAALPWRHEPAGPWLAALALIGLAIVAAMVGAQATVAATSRLSRWLPALPRLALTTVTAACLACGVVDLTCLAVLAAWTAVAPGSLAWAPAIGATLASFTRLALNGYAVRRCLALRIAPA
jgi:hypothetical protein